jgi:hypothetical protein
LRALAFAEMGYNKFEFWTLEQCDGLDVTSDGDVGLARRVRVDHDRGSYVLRIFSGLVTLFPGRG